jgi:hypothetical protein
MIERLIKADDGVHKWIALFSNGKQVRFGAQGFLDYTLGATPQQKMNYMARHKKDLETKDPYRPGYLSYYLLWSVRNLEAARKAYNRRFFS